LLVARESGWRLGVGVTHQATSNLVLRKWLEGGSEGFLLDLVDGLQMVQFSTVGDIAVGLASEIRAHPY
jgi:hypothetical protein